MDNGFVTEMLKNLREELSEEKLISVILRDIYVNDIIYVDSIDSWREYKKTRKSWEQFSNDFHSKLEDVTIILEKLIPKVFEIGTKLDDETKKHVVEKMFYLTKIILKRKYNQENIIQNCKKLFSIN